MAAEVVKTARGQFIMPKNSHNHWCVCQSFAIIRATLYYGIYPYILQPPFSETECNWQARRARSLYKMRPTINRSCAFLRANCCSTWIQCLFHQYVKPHQASSCRLPILVYGKFTQNFSFLFILAFSIHFRALTLYSQINYISTWISKYL